MLKFVHQRECRNLCQNLRIGRPHTTLAMSLGNLKNAQDLSKRKRMVGSGVMFSRYGASFDLRFLVRSHYYSQPSDRTLDRIRINVLRTMPRRAVFDQIPRV